MLRLRGTLTNAALRIRPEVLVARRRGAPAFRPVGPALSVTPSALAAIRAFGTYRTAPPHDMPLTAPCSATHVTRTFTSGPRWRGESPLVTSRRFIHARGAEAKPEDEEAGEKKAEADGGAQERGSKRKRKQQQSFADHIRGLREDYVKFPDIYNSANAINFIIFTVFCLCSTGSNAEERWWLEQWGLDHQSGPWSWCLHSFLTNNFLSMTYAMILIHSLGYLVLPTLGSRGLLLYVAGSATVSGAVIWLGNRLYYGDKPAPEKQFGPWDVVSALFVMQYLHFGISPITTLNSFSGWIKYAVWVGEVCIVYFDWQPTLVGAGVGLALCKGVPRFRVK